jgi:Holliday junction resolvasome RuvABC endonuclease subunit
MATYSAYQKRKIIHELAKYIDDKDLDGYTLGLDISLTKTGVAILDENGEYVESKLIRTYTSTGTIPQRLKKIQNELKEVLDIYEPKIICWESLRVGRNMDSFKKLSMVLASMMLTKTFRKVDVDPLLFWFGNSQIKSAVSGSNGDKNVVLKNLLKKWGIDVDKDDKADATIAAKLGYNSKVFSKRLVEYIESKDVKMYNLLLDIDKRRKQEFEDKIDDLDSDVVDCIFKKFKGQTGLDYIEMNNRDDYDRIRKKIKSYEKDN